MPNRHRSTGNRLYIAYRKIRLLAKRGTLFLGSKPAGTGRTEIPQGAFKTITVNSVLLFLIAYLIIYVVNLFITGYAAILFDIPVVVYYYDVDYLIRGIDWTPDSVSGVFSSGPLAMLVLSMFLIILYKYVETERGILRLLLLWMIFHALTRFFGEILVGAILSKGFGFVILYMFLMDTGKVVLTILGFVVMFTAGIIMARMSLYSANIYFNDLLKPFRKKFVFCQFIIPFIIGNIVILLIKIPQINYFDISLNASMMLFLIPILLRSMTIEDFYFDEDPRLIKANLIFPAVTLILLFSFRLILGVGVRL
ncbi:MAG: hypothetical protein Q8M08_04805 [Bacteroidales bacterium]|nr:hypothetical protein [Bacteroidales bacterium]